MNSCRLFASPQLRQPRPNEFGMNEFWITVGLMVAIFIFEFLTPSQFIFGYFYTAPILLASVWLRRRRIAQ
ncbi:MAG: hypothetical protein HC781_23165, partial [Leptolyngbyaceae cyanobacterium CSU_1_4]|nr:hypothetical protein [Leptolyngbyaceae cyanobacterium CSU_1_4]